MNELHVAPLADHIAHEMPGEDCICGPHIEIVPGGHIVVHRSLDGREKEEVPRSVCYKQIQSFDLCVDIEDLVTAVDRARGTLSYE